MAKTNISRANSSHRPRLRWPASAVRQPPLPLVRHLSLHQRTWCGIEVDCTLRIPTVAERLDVSQDTVRRLIARGLIRTIRIGASVRVSAEELEAFVKRHQGMRP